MYEIFGIAYGWNFSNAKVRWIIQEDLVEDLGGSFPYSGSGEASTYIGIDICELDCSNAQTSTLAQFNEDVQKALAKKLENHKFAGKIDVWRDKVLHEFKVCLDEEEITQEEYDEAKEILNQDPCLFWTWSTS